MSQSGADHEDHQHFLTAAEQVLGGHHNDVLQRSMLHVGTNWHLFAAGTSKAWQHAYTGLGKTRLTSIGVALATASTTQWVMGAGFRDVHRYAEKQICRYKYMGCFKRIESCAYSSSVCREKRPAASLKLCRQTNCKHQLNLMECLLLALEFGTPASLRWLLDHKTELFKDADAELDLQQLRNAAIAKESVAVLEALDDGGVLLRSTGWMTEVRF